MFPQRLAGGLEPAWRPAAPGLAGLPAEQAEVRLRGVKHRAERVT
ncbi:hypothetical protein [Streptomyces sp. NPDC004579]